MNSYQELPKWPACFITGEDITIDQSMEINFATDINASNIGFHSNDRQFAEDFSDKCGFAELRKLYLHNCTPSEKLKIITKYNLIDDNDIFKIRSALKKHLKSIPLDYFFNDQLQSHFINGANGWCMPSGKIQSFCNIGKWPSVEYMTVEWKQIAKQFPFLDLVCSVFDDSMPEEDDQDSINPVVTFVVKNGKVSIRPGDISLHKYHYKEFLAKADYHGSGTWPNYWINEFSKRTKPFMESLVNV